MAQWLDSEVWLDCHKCYFLNLSGCAGLSRRGQPYDNKGNLKKASLPC